MSATRGPVRVGWAKGSVDSCGAGQLETGRRGGNGIGEGDQSRSVFGFGQDPASPIRAGKLYGSDSLGNLFEVSLGLGGLAAERAHTDLGRSFGTADLSLRARRGAKLVGVASRLLRQRGRGGHQPEQREQHDMSSKKDHGWNVPLFRHEIVKRLLQVVRDSPRGKPLYIYLAAPVVFVERAWRAESFLTPGLASLRKTQALQISPRERAPTP